MKSFGKIGLLTLASFLFLVVQAQAISITMTGSADDLNASTASDDSGLTSIYADPFDDSAALLSSGFFIESFDQYDDNGALIGGEFNTLDPSKLIVTGGGFGVSLGSSASAATPANDDTYYGHTIGTPTTVTVPFNAFNAYQPGLYVSYLGLYYGSIDDYNEIAFLDYLGQPITGSGYLADGIISGSEILDSQGGNSGDRFGVGSNVYVNLFFDQTEKFSAFQFRTTGIAFEVDNIVAGVTNAVPEPATMFLFGLGLLGVAGVSRRKK